MTIINRRQFLRHLAGGALLLVGTTIGTQPEQAAAATKTTAANVTVTLSDGRRIQIVLNMDAMPVHIQNILYTVHVPEGTRATSITYTGNPLKGKERVQVVADLQPGNFSTDTVVTGLNRVFAVKSTTIMKRRPIIATGLSSAHLIARFTLT